MTPRRLVLPAALLAAIGVPLISISPTLDGGSAGSPEAWTTIDLSESVLDMEFGEAGRAYVPVNDLGEIIQFELTPNAVASRWANVSTAPASDGLQGMRVALVTGAGPADICGALTYYFDKDLRLQRIVLIGTTGDPRRLVQYLYDRFYFRSDRQAPDSLYTATLWRRTIGILTLAPAPVADAADPNRQVQLVLELNRPDGHLTISQGSQNLMKPARF